MVTCLNRWTWMTSVLRFELLGDNYQVKKWVKEGKLSGSKKSIRNICDCLQIIS